MAIVEPRVSAMKIAPSRSPSSAPSLHLGFPLVASLAFIGVGAVAFGVALLGGAAPPMRLLSLMLVAVAAIELAAGLHLQRAGEDAMQFILGGALTLSLALVGLMYMSAAEGMALMVGLYLLVNALFRGMDVAIDRPRPWGFEAAYALVGFALAVFILSRWRTMDATGVLMALAAELVLRGVSLEGSAWAARRAHPWVQAQAQPVSGQRERVASRFAPRRRPRVHG